MRSLYGICFWQLHLRRMLVWICLLDSSRLTTVQLFLLAQTFCCCSRIKLLLDEVNQLDAPMRPRQTAIDINRLCRPSSAFFLLRAETTIHFCTFHFGNQGDKWGVEMTRNFSLFFALLNPSITSRKIGAAVCIHCGHHVVPDACRFHKATDYTSSRWPHPRTLFKLSPVTSNDASRQIKPAGRSMSWFW